MNDVTSDRSGGSGATWTVSILIALVLYVLSPMPVIRILIVLYGPNPPVHVVKSFGMIYAPIIWLTDKNQSAKQFYDWYGRVWHAR